MNTSRSHFLVVICILSIFLTPATSAQGVIVAGRSENLQGPAAGPASSLLPTGWTKQDLLDGQATQQSRNILQIGQFGGDMSPFAVQGKYLYAAVGSWLVIQKITNPAAPVSISRTIVTAGISNGIFVSGDYAYVAGGEPYAGYELSIINISNPAKPYKVGSFSLDCSFVDTAVRGDYAYISTGDVCYFWGCNCRGSLDIVDISNPSSPVEVGSLSNEDIVPLALAVAGDYAYQALRAYDRNGLQIIDISNPSDPVEASVYSISVIDFKVSDQYAYISNEEGLSILNISNPANPVEVGSFNILQGLEDMVVAGSYVFATGANDSEAGTLHILDVSDPVSPFEAGSYGFSGYNSGMAVNGNYLFVAADPCRVYILDISNPAQPVEVDSSFGPGCVGEVELAGDTAYTIDRLGKLSIVDVSHPAKQKEVGYINIPGEVFELAVRGDYAYVAGDGLHILDVSNPASPAEVGSLSIPNTNYPVALAVAGNYAYLVVYEAGLYIMDISTPSDPVQVGFYSGTFDDMDLAGNYAYLADHDSLRILDISSPPNPVEVGSINISDNPSYGAVEVAENIAYTTFYTSSQIHIIDVSNPTAPIEVGSYDLSDFGNAYPMAVLGNNLYVTFHELWTPHHPSGPGSLYILDISDPLHPREAGFYKPLEWAPDVEVAGNTIYVANGSEGLLVLTYLRMSWYLPMVSMSR